MSDPQLPVPAAQPSAPPLQPVQPVQSFQQPVQQFQQVQQVQQVQQHQQVQQFQQFQPVQQCQQQVNYAQPLALQPNLLQTTNCNCAHGGQQQMVMQMSPISNPIPQQYALVPMGSMTTRDSRERLGDVAFIYGDSKHTLDLADVLAHSQKLQKLIGAEPDALEQLVAEQPLVCDKSLRMVFDFIAGREIFIVHEMLDKVLATAHVLGVAELCIEMEKQIELMAHGPETAMIALEMAGHANVQDDVAYRIFKVISHLVDRLEIERLSLAELRDVAELLPIANIPLRQLDDFAQRLRETVEFYFRATGQALEMPDRFGVTSGFEQDTGSMNSYWQPNPNRLPGGQSPEKAKPTSSMSPVNFMLSSPNTSVILPCRSSSEGPKSEPFELDVGELPPSRTGLWEFEFLFDGKDLGQNKPVNVDLDVQLEKPQQP
ncbi:unnamed protein product, partial [Mesorhabditis spiculigera]